MQTPELDKILNYYLFLELNEYVREDYEIEYFNWEDYGLSGDELSKSDYPELYAEITSNLLHQNIDVKKSILKFYFTSITDKIMHLKCHHKHISKTEPRKPNKTEEKVEEILNQVLITILHIGKENSIYFTDLIDNSINLFNTKNTVLENFKLIPKDFAESNNKLLENPYPEMFVDHNSFLLFEKLHLNFKLSSTILVDYSLIYRMMHKDKLILTYIRPEMYKTWLKENFKIELKHSLKDFIDFSSLKELSYSKIKMSIFNK